MWITAFSRVNNQMETKTESDLNGKKEIFAYIVSPL
jgi:hypothetical protein